MKAVAKTAPVPGAVELIDIQMPTRNAHEAIVRITGAGICGTDVSIKLWRPAIARAYAPTFPNVLGHEFCGVVEEVDNASGFRRGDAVVVNPQLACGCCRHCVAGEQTLCDRRRLMGGHIGGGWAEFVAVPVTNLLKVPDALATGVVPLIEPLAVGVHSVFQRVRPKEGDVAVVIGPGPIGLIHALLLKRAGASIVFVSGLSRDATRLQVADAIGAIPIESDVRNLEEAVLAQAQQGADVVYTCSGAVTELAEACKVVRKGGRIAALGLPGEATAVEVTSLVMRQVEIVGTRGYNDSTWPLVMTLLEEIAEDAKRLVSHEIPLRQYDTAFDLVERRQAVKVVLRPDFGLSAGLSPRLVPASIERVPVIGTSPIRSADQSR